MNHTEVVLDVARYVADVQAARDIGYEYVSGETSSGKWIRENDYSIANIS